jgi:hypothetical protein
VSTLPASIGNWSDVEIFLVEYNNLTGPLPEDIALWSRLKSFDVLGNQLTGTLPSGIGQCTALEKVCTVDQKAAVCSARMKYAYFLLTNMWYSLSQLAMAQCEFFYGDTT